MNISYIDKLRGISIIMVFLFHVLGASYGVYQLPWNGMFRDFSHPPFGMTFYVLYPFTFGWLGVALFFVISGFCIHLSFMRNPSYIDFFKKRFFRIYPPYFIVLLIVILRNWGTTQFSFISHLFLFQNLFPSTLYDISGSFWSIAVEFQLYLIYPLLYLFARKFGWKASLILVGSIELSIHIYHIYCVFNNDEEIIYTWTSPFGYWFSWSLGAYLADQYLNNRTVVYSNFYIFLCCLGAILVSFYRPIIFFAFPLVCVATMMLISNNLNKEAEQSALDAHLKWIGMISYSFYLIHQPIVKFVAFAIQVIGIRDHFLVFIGTSFSYVFIAYLSFQFYKIIELNSIKFGKSLRW